MGEKSKSMDYVKQKTIELYDSLPQEKSERMARLDVRDQVIDLNYAFFGYVATKTFINNRTVTYEDKLQSALMHFLECWWWYKWKGDDKHKGYRQDLSFTVFFKPRIGEMIERELNEVKYSLRRSLCMEVGAQLGKHWGQVRYEDLGDPRLDIHPDKMNSLKAIFGTMYIADISDHEGYLEDKISISSKFENISDEYDDIESLLIHDMILLEERLDDQKLKEMSEIYGIDIHVLRDHLPRAEKRLHDELSKSIQIQEGVLY